MKRATKTLGERPQRERRAEHAIKAKLKQALSANAISSPKRSGVALSSGTETATKLWCPLSPVGGNSCVEDGDTIPKFASDQAFGNSRVANISGDSPSLSSFVLQNLRQSPGNAEDGSSSCKTSRSEAFYPEYIRRKHLQYVSDDAQGHDDMSHQNHVTGPSKIELSLPTAAYLASCVFDDEHIGV